MVVPIETGHFYQTFRKYHKDKDGKVTFKDIVDCGFVPLTDEKKQRIGAIW